MERNIKLSSLGGHSWNAILGELMRIISRDWDKNEFAMMDIYQLIGRYVEEKKEFIHCDKQGMEFEATVIRMKQNYVHKDGQFGGFQLKEEENETPYGLDNFDVESQFV